MIRRLVLALLLGTCCLAAGGDDLHTIYLVRHAEKVADGSDDPRLTQCGVSRANALAEIFHSVELAGVYSTDYGRTRATAEPTAAQQNLDVVIYDPTQLREFAAALKSGKRDVLVVGHSDTTATLVGHLINDERYGPFEESIYDRLYQVVLSDSGGRNHLLQQNFRCGAP